MSEIYSLTRVKESTLRGNGYIIQNLICFWVHLQVVQLIEVQPDKMLDGLTPNTRQVEARASASMPFSATIETCAPSSIASSRIYDVE